MTELIYHRHSFISHREHRGHRVLIWIAEGAIQIKSRLNGTIAGNLPRQGLSIWPDFLSLPCEMHFLVSISPGPRNQAKLFISVNSGNSSDCKERARETQEVIISEYTIIFTNQGTKFLAYLIRFLELAEPMKVS